MAPFVPFNHSLLDLKAHVGEQVITGSIAIFSVTSFIYINIYLYVVGFTFIL